MGASLGPQARGIVGIWPTGVAAPAGPRPLCLGSLKVLEAPGGPACGGPVMIMLLESWREDDLVEVGIEGVALNSNRKQFGW